MYINLIHFVRKRPQYKLCPEVVFFKFMFMHNEPSTTNYFAQYQDADNQNEFTKSFITSLCSYNLFKMPFTTRNEAATVQMELLIKAFYITCIWQISS